MLLRQREKALRKERIKNLFILNSIVVCNYTWNYTSYIATAQKKDVIAEGRKTMWMKHDCSDKTGKYIKVCALKSVWFTWNDFSNLSSTFKILQLASCILKFKKKQGFYLRWLIVKKNKIIFVFNFGYVM